MKEITFYHIYTYNAEGKKIGRNFWKIENALEWIRNHPEGKDILFNRKVLYFEDGGEQ